MSIDRAMLCVAASGDEIRRAESQRDIIGMAGAFTPLVRGMKIGKTANAERD
jgi:hypothetical protein